MLIDLIQLDGNTTSPSVVDLNVISDALFLIGGLALHEATKSEMSDMKVVECVVKLLKRTVKVKGKRLSKRTSEAADSIEQCPSSISRCQTNCCLSLAALTIGHHKNVATFVRHDGVSLSLKVLSDVMKGDGRKGMIIGDTDYDVASAAAVLICNSSYRRPEIQASYGAAGVCGAWTRVRC